MRKERKGGIPKRLERGQEVWKGWKKLGQIVKEGKEGTEIGEKGRK